MYFNGYIQFGLSPYKCEVGKPQYHYHICFCYYWHNKLRRQFVCAVVRVIESNYPMLGKWLCTKRNPSGIHKAISEVRQSWNVGALHINCSRSTTSFERTSQPWIGDNCTWFTQTVSPTNLAMLRVLSQCRAAVSVVVDLQRNNSAEWERRAVIIERAWHKQNEECLEWRTISNEPYQLKVREQCLHSHSKARH